ncbi:hypothetical protein BDW59DRAFT_163690 [Aspergillus cavernicola]|uniref:Uncharacterized protein n=1 Tax=Aspergillus cavernicola TaxID=176166 RepID=A0ABR4I4Z9_9EURO
MLAGHKCKHEAPTKFRNHLPPQLQSFGLYIDDNFDWLLQYIPQYAEELEGIATAGACGPSSVTRTILPTERMEHKAAQHGMFFASSGNKYLLFASDETYWGDLNNHSPPIAVANEIARNPMRVIPWGVEVNGYRGKLRNV